jgi:penicillin-binding protein 1A
LLVAPSYYAPTGNLKRAQDRASVVLGLMHAQGYLTDAELAQARANPATLSAAASQRAGGYFADWVMETVPSFLSRETTEDVLIHTTLDQHLQKAVETALTFVFETKVREGSKAQAAVVVMSADGAVRAMVGRAATGGARRVQPRDPGPAPDRQRVQALCLCRRDWTWGGRRRILSRTAR